MKNEIPSKKKKKKFDLDDVVNYMSKVELGEQPTIEERDNIGEFVDGLREKNTYFDEGGFYE